MARKVTRTVARKTARGRRARRVNPLIPFTRADAEVMRRYRSVASEQSKKRAKRLGLPIPTEGKAMLFKVGDRVLDTLEGRPVEMVRGADRRKVTHRSSERDVQTWSKRLGMYVGRKTWVPRNELLNLQVFMQRHPGKLSKAAEKAIRSRIANRTTREWWNIVDSTSATKFADETGESNIEMFAATYGPPQSCPADCGMRGAAPGTPGCDDPDVRACYAGEHNALQQWKALYRGYTGLPWGKLPSKNQPNGSGFLGKLASTPATMARVNIAGDLPADPRDPSGRHLDRKRVLDLAKAAVAKGRTAFTYTHYDPSYKDNAKIIRDAMKTGFQINLSADNLTDADRKVDMGFDVAVVLPRIVYDEAKAYYPKYLPDGKTPHPQAGRPIPGAKGKIEKSGRRLLLGQGAGLSTPKGRKIFFCPSITTTSMRKEAKARFKRLQKRLAAEVKRPLNVAERAAIIDAVSRSTTYTKDDLRGRKGKERLIGKTCSTCSRFDTGTKDAAGKAIYTSGPECARIGRARIIGFLAHGSAGAAKNLDVARAEELLRAPEITPIARHEVHEAINRTLLARAKQVSKETAEGRAKGLERAGVRPEDALKAVEREKQLKKRGLVLANPRRRNSTATRQSARRARLARLERLAASIPPKTSLSHWRRR